MYIDYYKDKLELTKSLQELIARKYKDVFYAVIVHGSVATGEVIPYSDFDGLIIVKDSYVNSKKLKQFKRSSMKYILKFDPLQHHGWFEMSESELLDYPESYLPTSVLEKAKLLYPITPGIELNISRTNIPDYKTGLLRMMDQFEKRDSNGWRPKNIYELKSVMSQLMLVPCLYFSAKNNAGIFKRESFDAVRGSFTTSEWLAIKVCSQIRKDWKYSMNPLQKVFFTIPNRFFRKIISKYYAPKIPQKFLELLNEDFYNSILLLNKKIKKEIT
ncbi:MAG: nucleotidyltransferase domain-containing protein [Flavobacteriaceae bacterium]